MIYNEKKSRIKRISVIAMFCALAYVCMLVIRIPVQFLSLDIKDSLIILAGLLFGPASAVVISLIVPLAEFITISSTGVYGLIMNILSTLVFAATVSLIYKYKKTFYGAIIGLASGVVAMVAVMMIANLLITPYYIGATMQDVARLIPKLLLPFNFIKGLLNAALVLIFYKPLSNVLKKSGIIEHQGSEKTDSKKSAKRYIIMTLISVAIIAASLAVIFFVLRA